jgi:hypothetical protein
MDLWTCQLETRFYCSMACRASWQRENGSRAGDRNPAWKGGTGNKGAYWKRKARERDAFTCQFPGCGKQDRGKGTHAHHLVPRVAGGEDSLDNLVTLCSRHHREVESRLFLVLVQRYPQEAARLAREILKEE